MTNRNDYAFPSTAPVFDQRNNYYMYGNNGMTMREEFARSAMVGLLSGPTCLTQDEIPAQAVKLADALIVELSK